MIECIFTCIMTDMTFSMQCPCFRVGRIVWLVISAAHICILVYFFLHSEVSPCLFIRNKISTCHSSCEHISSEREPCIHICLFCCHLLYGICFVYSGYTSCSKFMALVMVVAATRVAYSDSRGHLCRSIVYPDLSCFCSPFYSFFLITLCRCFLLGSA